MARVDSSRGSDSKFFVVSGIGPSASGVGRLMRRLLPQLEKEGFQTVIHRTPSSLRQMICSHEYFRIAEEVIARACAAISLRCKSSRIRNSTVLFAHPQTAGFATLFRLVDLHNRVFLYVMDNSYFCLRSYNHFCGKECLRCLGSPRRVPKECNPFPVRIAKRRNIEYLLRLQKYSRRITFLVQNKNQRRLVVKQFGRPISCHVVGMWPADLELCSSHSRHIASTTITHAELVYHGGLSEAKGIRYAVYLAEKLSNRTMLVPFAASQVREYLGIKDLPDNLLTIPLTWDTGLRQMVEAAEMVLVPSLWSSTVEGALLKSLIFNGTVATVATQYGFEEELHRIGVVVRLPPSPVQAAGVIESVWGNLEEYRLQAKKWISEFLKCEPVERILSVVHG